VARRNIFLQDHPAGPLPGLCACCGNSSIVRRVYPDKNRLVIRIYAHFFTSIIYILRLFQNFVFILKERP
jgi:hypothetical protein